jgi:sugar transferase (PEP-CTERM system associated)
MFKISNHYVSKVVSSLLVLELLILIGSFYAGAGMRFFDGGPFALPRLDHFFLSACVFAAAIIFSMSALGMYHIDFSAGLAKPFFLQLLPAFAMGFCILTLIFYVEPDLYFGRGVLLLVFTVATGGIALVRFAFRKTSESSYLKSRVLFLGSGTLAMESGHLALQPGSYRKYQIVGYVPIGTEECCVPEQSLLPLAEGVSLLTMARRHGVTEIVVSVQNRRNGAYPIKDLLACKLAGIHITDADSFFERETCQIRVESMQPSWLVFGSGFDQTFRRIYMKRSFDVAVSLVMLILTMPIMLFTALCILIEDGAPVFYQQERIGLDGKPFKVLKFRSMGSDAEKNGKPQWAAKNDPRITRVGNVIRRTRIDELPQIWNVFKGEMSFVGPRPEREYFARLLTEGVPYYNIRHCLKPGITGWAQVRYGYGDSLEDSVQKLRYDLYYVKNNSLLLDVLILIDTVKVVLFGAGR